MIKWGLSLYLKYNRFINIIFEVLIGTIELFRRSAFKEFILKTFS